MCHGQTNVILPHYPMGVHSYGFITRRFDQDCHISKKNTCEQNVLFVYIYIYMFIVYILQCTIRTYQTSHHVLCVFCCWEKAALQIEASEPQKTQTLASTVQPGGEKGRGWDGGRAFGGSEKSRDFQGFTWESKVYMDTPGLEASTIN